MSTSTSTAARITSPFGWASTAAEVIAGIDLTGKRAIVTGGASGIGVETGRALASAGAEVTLAVRNLEAGRATAAEITSTTGNDKVFVAPLDLSDQASVAAFVANWQGPLDILINNAGVMASPLMRTPQGWEMQFATNFYGHFALSLGLHDALAAATHARVVSVSSSGHISAGVDFDDIHFDRRDYSPWAAYSQSKSADVLFAVEATKRWAADGITVNAGHPGAIRTALQRHVTEDEIQAMRNRTGGAVRSGSQSSKGPPPPVSWRRHRSSTASAGVTSRTATKPSRISPAPGPVSPRTRWIR
jgi:NAD(P)-dependent dehydrogenase (short-subunit alcohol dehydrogenase family)